MAPEERIKQLEHQLDATRRAAVFLAVEFMSSRPARRDEIAAELLELAEDLDGPAAMLARDIASELRLESKER